MIKVVRIMAGSGPPNCFRLILCVGACSIARPRPHGRSCRSAFLWASGHCWSYKAGDYLYHESTPRLWMGIVEEGEVEIVRGLHGSSVRLATLIPGIQTGAISPVQ